MIHKRKKKHHFETVYHLDQREVKFVDKSLFFSHSGLVRSDLDGYTDDKVPNT